MKRWYVVQVYAGYEHVIKEDLLRRIQNFSMQDNFGEILVPTAKLKHFFEGVDAESQQLFPGYILIEMDMEQQAARLVLACPRVNKFLGGDSPMPLSQKEIERITSQIHGDLVIKNDSHGFVMDSEVEIQDGPFAGFMGIVKKIDLESEKLVVMVSIFGRMTPVELHFNQVKH